MSPFLSRTLLALAACKTPTDYYRVQIDIQKHATPADVALLKDRPLAWSSEFDAWLDGLFATMTDSHGEIRPYRLRQVGDAISLYSGCAAAPDLVVAFCGRADLLFMPLALILQYFSPERCDVLVLRDPSKIGFAAGIRAHSASFREMIDKLRLDLDVNRYTGISTFGTSGGGAAALAAGLLLNASRAVSFSGHLPSASAQYGRHPAAAELESILRQARRAPNYACVYGAAHVVDAGNALALSKLLRVRLCPVAGIAYHNVVFELHRRRTLGALMADVGLI